MVNTHNRAAPVAAQNKDRRGIALGKRGVMEKGAYLSRRFGIYVKTWKWSKQAPKGPLFGKTSWSNKAMKGTSFYHEPSWTFNFWIGRRMVCVSRNCA